MSTILEYEYDEQGRIKRITIRTEPDKPTPPPITPNPYPYIPVDPPYYPYYYWNPIVISTTDNTEV